MLTFVRGMDPHSVDVNRDGMFIGFLMWHPKTSQAPHFETWDTYTKHHRITVEEMRTIIEWYDKNVTGKT